MPSFCWSIPMAAASGRSPRERPTPASRTARPPNAKPPKKPAPLGIIEPRHFHVYIHSKGVFWQPGGVQEYVVKAFLMEVRQKPATRRRRTQSTWFSCQGSARDSGQGPRSEIRARTAGRDRPRARTHRRSEDGRRALGDYACCCPLRCADVTCLSDAFLWFRSTLSPNRAGLCPLILIC